MPELANRIEIEYKDLNPRVQLLVDSEKATGERSSFLGIPDHSPHSVKGARYWRNLNYAASALLGGGSILNFILTKQQINWRVATFLPNVIIGKSQFIFYKRVISNMAKEMAQSGVIISSYEKYPKGWMNASKIMETHPLFYVRGNGNVVFTKVDNSLKGRIEYFRWHY